MTREEARIHARANLGSLKRKKRSKKSREEFRSLARGQLNRLSEGDSGAPEESWLDFGAQVAGDVALGSIPAALTFAVTSPLGPWVSIPAAGAVGSATGGIGGRIVDNLIGEDEAAKPLDPSEIAYDALFGAGFGLAGKAAGAGLRRLRGKKMGQTGSAFVRWLEDSTGKATDAEDLARRDPYQSLNRTFTQTPELRKRRLREIAKSRIGNTATAREIIGGRARDAAEKRLQRHRHVRKMMDKVSDEVWERDPQVVLDRAREVGWLKPDEVARYKSVVERGSAIQKKYADFATEETGKRYFDYDRETMADEGVDFVKDFAHRMWSRLFQFKRPHAMFRQASMFDEDRLISKTLEAVGVDNVAVEQTYQRLSNQIGVHGSEVLKKEFYDYAIGAKNVSNLNDIDQELVSRYWRLQQEIFDLADLENILVLHKGPGDDALFKNIGGKASGQLVPMKPKWEGGVPGRYAMQAVDPEKVNNKQMLARLEQQFPGSVQHHQARGHSHMFGRVDNIPDEYLIKDYKRLLNRQRVMHAHTISQGLNLGGHVSDSLMPITQKGQQTYVHGWLKAFYEHTQRSGHLEKSNMLREVMSDFYDAEQDTALRGAVRVLKDVASRVYLPRNYIPQMTEAMNVFGFARVSDLTDGHRYHKRYGLKNTWAKTMGSVQDQVADVLSENEKHHVTALMARKTDRAAREFGIEPLTGKLLRMARRAGDSPTAAELWEAAEAFPLELNDMESWRKVVAIGDGSTEEAQELLRQGVDNLIRRQMHLFTSTTTPPIMRHPGSSMVLQFRTFSLNAAGRFYEDIIGPMRYGHAMFKAGIEAGDKTMKDQGRELAMLGVKRFSRATVLGFAPQTAGRALRTILDKNTEGWDENDWISYLAQQGARDTITMQAGVYGDFVNIFMGALAGDTKAMDQFLGAIPGANVVADTAGRTIVGTGQIARGVLNDRPDNVQAGLNQVFKGLLNMGRVMFPNNVPIALAPSPTGGTVRALEDAILD